MHKERPIVNIENKPNIHLEIELFQNKVLRPILKMQHDLILCVFNEHIHKLSIQWKGLMKGKQLECVDNQLTQNVQLKNTIIGVIIGQLNESEIEQYFINSRDYNKRIIRMSIQRIQSTI